MNVNFEINGVAKTVDVEPRTLVVDLIRTKLGMTGTHIGCDTSNCGACTVLLDGRPATSCTLLAPMLEGNPCQPVGRFVEAAHHSGQLGHCGFV